MALTSDKADADFSMLFGAVSGSVSAEKNSPYLLVRGPRVLARPLSAI